MAFRAGAFRVAHGFSPEPLLLPVAVANFDKQIAKNGLAAKIFPSIRMSDSVLASATEATLYDVINTLRQRYRGYVVDAVRLANPNNGDVPSSAPAATGRVETAPWASRAGSWSYPLPNQPHRAQDRSTLVFQEPGRERLIQGM